jgi:hypothetical protein
MSPGGLLSTGTGATDALGDDDATEGDVLAGGSFDGGVAV